MRAVVVLAILAACNASPPPDARTAPAAAELAPSPAAGVVLELEDYDGTPLGPGLAWVHRPDGTWALRLVLPFSSCGSICSSGIECSFGVLKPCPFCNFGSCKNTRPE